VIKGFGQAKTDTSVYVKYHDKIDDIQNVHQIELLLKSIDKDYSNFKITDLSASSDEDCKRIYDSLHIQQYSKSDFDKNGYTDLLVIGERYNQSIVCILGYGENKFTINRLTRRSFQDCSFPIVTTENHENFIDYYYFKPTENWREYDTSKTLQSKKLTYKFGDFIEYNLNPKKYSIKKIEYETTMCFGTCPVFNLTINADHSARYEAVKYNKHNGKFKGTIDDKSFQELTELLNYIDFPGLKDNYSVRWTDDQTFTLKITYNNGLKKVITDYGKLGTFGLERVYNILFSLRESQKWK
jgi:hypothetical protein